MNDHETILSLLPRNVKLVFYNYLIPNKVYCIFRNDPCFYPNTYRKCYGTFVKNENLFCEEICSRFDNFGGIGETMTINNYPVINPLKMDITQKFYFFETPYKFSIEEKKRLLEMRWFMIQKIFLEPNFREQILGPGLEFIGSINVYALKEHFFKN